MTNLRKLTVCLFIAMLVFVFVACDQNVTTPTNQATPTDQPTTTQTGETTASPTGEPTETGDMTFELNRDGKSYSVTKCKTSVQGEVIIPSNFNGIPVTVIGEQAFCFCEGITSIVIPDSIITISNWAFMGCDGLTSVTIPDSVTSIGEDAFQFCRQLASITIGNGVTDIGPSAFSFCDSLTSITIPDNVIRLGRSVFYASEALTQVNIGSGVSGELDEFSFSNCNKLATINVDKDNEFYSSDDAGVLFNKDKTELICAPKTIKGTYTIPDGVTTIAKSAFNECNGLTRIIIPESVTQIGIQAFMYCDDFEVFYCGTQEQRNAINFESGDRYNGEILNATWHYEYEQ